MESISKISSMLETARDLTLEAAQSAGSVRSQSTRSSIRDMPFAQVKNLLDSRNDREILEGLRKVISMMYRSKPCLPYFSSVVKNVASPDIKIKKLVYIYLLHYAESEPDLALLSINTIQKSLTDQNPQVRAMALRVMSGIRVPVISQIVSLAIKRGCGDMSPYVRKAAALAIPKCYRLEPNTLPQLLEYLSTLLGDKQYYVVGFAIMAFLEVCPDRVDLIHKHYRGLVKKLVDMDEWGQLATLKLILIYARKCFPRKTKKLRKTKTKSFYEEEGTKEGADSDGEEVQVLDPDLELFLKACKPLSQSRNSAVIVAVVRCFLHLGTPEHLDSVVGPLIALLRSPQDIQNIALYNVVAICLVRPQSFVKYTSHFLVHASDTPPVWRLKLEVLTLVFPHCESHIKCLILSELEHFTRASDSELVQECVRAIGRCAQNDSATSSRCLSLLFKQISSQDGQLVAESLTVIRHLIQQDPNSHTKTVVRLAKSLDTTTNPQARATIIWLVGEYAGVPDEENIAPDVLRILAKCFTDESEAAKLQIVLLAAKVYLHHLNRQQKQSSENKPTQSISPLALPPESLDSNNFADPPSPQPSQESPATHPIEALWRYILLLARYDTSYDLRDRMRLYKALLSSPTSTELASLMLLAPKPVPSIPSPSESRKDFLLGSASLVVGADVAGREGLPGYEALPDWVMEGDEPDRRLRDEGTAREYGEKVVVPAGERLEEAVKAKVGEGGGVKKGKEKTLDDWLAEGEEEEDSEEDGTEDEDEESGEDENAEEDSEEEEGGGGESSRLVSS